MNDRAPLWAVERGDAKANFGRLAERSTMVRMRCRHKPPPSHSWRRPFFSGSRRPGGTLREAVVLLQAAGYILASLRPLQIHESCGLGVYDIVVAHGAHQQHYRLSFPSSSAAPNLAFTVRCNSSPACGLDSSRSKQVPNNPQVPEQSTVSRSGRVLLEP
jgi:hypothetical protein